MATKSIFSDFEEFGAAGGTKLVYGVNVLQIEAEVKIAAGEETVGDLVNRYRTMLNLPADVVVFVDGAKVSMTQAVPADAQRIEIVKPAGAKASHSDETPKIELAPENAARIVVASEVTTNYVLRTPVVEGKMSKSLETHLATMGLEVLSSDQEYLTVGRYVTETRATRKSLVPVAHISRRTSGGVAEMGSVTINTVTAGLGETPLRVELNGQPFTGCRELQAGDQLLVVLPGGTREEDFEAWAASQRQFADGAAWAAQIDRDEAVEKRAKELEAMSWIGLRIAGRKAGVKISGLGRNAEAIRADILAREFPAVDEEAVRKAYLEENAPELLEA